MTTWNPITKATETTSGSSTINPGNPIGLLLALTYATTSSTVGVNMWTPITKATGTSWTPITKAT